ncbi:MAG: hypothetical protein Alpg2KO_00970 [Alphaproteobacteria bacterium]
MTKRDPRRYLTKAGLAVALDIQRPTVDNWVKFGLPYLEKPGEDGKREWLFDLGDVIRWLLLNMQLVNGQIRQKSLTHKHDAGDGDQAIEPLGPNTPYSESERREKAAMAGMRELNLAREQGKTLYIEELAPVLDNLCVETRTQLLMIPQRISHECAAESDANTVERLMDDELKDALEVLSEGTIIDRLFDDDDD